MLHGGGNTSLKARTRDRLGDKVEVLRVKPPAPTWRRSTANGFCAVRLAPMRKLRALDRIGDDELVGIERANLIDPAAPNPSVEMMLHAFLPQKFVDHTHATAVLSVIDQPDGEKECVGRFRAAARLRALRDAGLRACQKSHRSVRARKPRDGLILSKHGIVTYGEDARARPTSA